MGPFVKSNNKTSKMMRNLFISLLPIILFSFYKNGIVPYKNGSIGALEMLYPLIFVLIGMLSSLLVEEIYVYVFQHKRGKDLIDSVINGYGMLPGLFLSLILPINTPLSVLFVGCIVSIVIGKMLFGGFGNNIFNPALVGCIFVMACFSATISSNGGYLNKYEIDTIAGSTPLTNVSLVEGIGTYDELVKPYGNLWNFFIGSIPGAIGETSKLLILVAFIYLTLTKTIKWRISLFYVLTVFVMTFIIGSFNGLGIWYPLFQVLSGGLLFGAVFMATDPVTSPVNRESQDIYGVCLGILTVILRYLTSYPEGVMTSILFMNMCVFFIDKKTIKYRYNMKYYFICMLVLILVGSSLSYAISTKYSKTKDTTDTNYNIVSKKHEDSKTIYQVTQKGFGGNIKAEIIFDSKKIISITVLENSESKDRYKLVTDNKYIDSLIKGQDKLKDVDTVTGATITSTALKKMVTNTLDDFSKNTGEVEEKTEKKVTIKNVVEDSGMTTYTVDTDSFGGVMELEIVMKGNEIKTVVPITYSDSCVDETHKNPYYTCPQYMDNGYINELIKNQDNIDSVDTVSGATISSSALKNTIKEMKEGN